MNNMKRTLRVFGTAVICCFAVAVVAMPAAGLAAPGDESDNGANDALTESDVFEIGFRDSLPSTVPADPRRALSFPFHIEHSGGLHGMHLHLVANVESTDALSVLLLGPEGTTWALDNEALVADSAGRVDSWLDLLEPGTEFERDARNMPVSGTWTVQVFHLRSGHESTLADLELVIGVGARGASHAVTEDRSSAPEASDSAGDIETKKFALGTAAAPADGCGEKGGKGCGVFAGETDPVSTSVLLGLVLGLIAFLSLRSSRRQRSTARNGGER